MSKSLDFCVQMFFFWNSRIRALVSWIIWPSASGLRLLGKSDLENCDNYWSNDNDWRNRKLHDINFQHSFKQFFWPWTPPGLYKTLRISDFRFPTAVAKIRIRHSPDRRNLDFGRLSTSKQGTACSFIFEQSRGRRDEFSFDPMLFESSGFSIAILEKLGWRTIICYLVSWKNTDRRGVVRRVSWLWTTWRSVEENYWC